MKEVAVRVPSGTYAAIDFGGSGPDVLLIHQIASSAQVWATLGPELAAVAHPVAIDLCGHGLTRVVEESITRLVDDLGDVVDALGLTHPLVVVESEELLSLLGDQAGRHGARGFLVVGPFTSRRGKAAQREYEDILGIASLADWDQRNDMFVSGSDEQREAFVEKRVALARADWVNEPVSEHQLRTYVQRQIRDTPDGWERVPRRPLVEQALEMIGRGPYGLDLYDRLPLPVWLAVGARTVRDAEVNRFARWAEERGSARVAFLPGYDAPDSFEPAAFARFVGEMLAAIESAPDSPPDPTIARRNA